MTKMLMLVLTLMVMLLALAVLAEHDACKQIGLPVSTQKVFRNQLTIVTYMREKIPSKKMSLIKEQ